MAYDLGPPSCTHKLQPEGWGHFPDSSGGPVIRKAHEVKRRTEDGNRVVDFEWRDLGPDKIQLEAPLVSIEKKNANGSWFSYSNANGVPVDDRGAQLEVRLLPPNFRNISEAGREWRVTWYAGSLCSTESLRFVVAERHGVDVLTSEPFNLPCSAPKIDLSAPLRPS